MHRFSRVACLLAFLVVYDGLGHAQSYKITTYAGPAFPVNGVRATTLSVVSNSVIADAAGGFYVSNIKDSTVYHVTATGTIAVTAGTGSKGFGGDGGPATAAQLNLPTSLALDSIGNLIIADSGNNRVRKVTPSGVISTVAGSGITGSVGDGGLATATQVFNPTGVAVDVAGNLFIATYNRIRRVSPSGIITTVAGIEDLGFSGDGGPATSAQLKYPNGVAVDLAGNLFIADSENNRIRKVTPSGVITTVPNGEVHDPLSVAVDATGALLIATDNQIKKLTPNGSMTIVAGQRGAGFGGDGGPAVSAFLYQPNGVAVDAVGNLFIADTYNARVRKVDTAGIISTVAGNGLGSFSGDGGPATFAQLDNPNGMAVDSNGNLFIADTNNHRVRKVTLSGVISTIAGNGTQTFSGDGGPAISAGLPRPDGVAIDMAGNLFIATSGRIRKVISSGIISTVAGVGSSGFSGDGGPATSAELGFAPSVAVDTVGNLLIACFDSGRIRRVDLSGIISTLAGIGNFGFSGDGGPATSASMIGPVDVSTDQSGNLFIADSQNNRIRKVIPSGIISTVAGNGNSGFTGNPAFSGDGGPATQALLSDPHGVTVDGDGNLFIADSLNHRIRKVTPSGIISTVAGTGDAGFSGDGGSAAAAQLNYPTDIVVDSKNNLFVADTLNNRIRKLTPITESRTFSISDRGGISLTTSGTEAAVRAGYASIQPNGLTTPSGVAIVGFRQNNVLVSEASTPASSLIRAGRIYAEIDGPVNTGLAIANPNDQPATISFYFMDASGNFGSGSTVIPAKGQIAKFLNEAPFNGRSSLSGTLTFNSSVPVAVIALRGLTNERSEFLITTLPVADLSANTESSIFPHFADGGGWRTQIVLVNTGDTTATGTVQFLSPSGQAATVAISGLSNSSFAYSIAPRSSQKLQTSGAGTAAQVGSVRILPVAGSSPFSGVAIFSFRNGGVTVAEAGVPAVPTENAFRLYAETAGSRGAMGSIQTGIAVANATTSAATVIVELHRLDGSSTGLTGTLSVPAAGQVATFLNEIPGLASLPAPFQGVLRVSSTQPISVVGLRGRYNERNDFLITTTPPINEATPASSSRLFFPQIVDGGGYTTQFILISGQPGQTSSGTMQWFSQSGEALGLTLQ